MGGEESCLDDELGRLTEEESIILANAWEVWARPGQRWVPGPETITYYSAGRGFGKSFILSHILGEASLQPDRWAGEVLLIGITPADVRSLLEQDTGIIRVAQEWGYPEPKTSWSLGRGELHFPDPSGGRGLHVRIASSAKPASARGPNVGLLLADEWAFFQDTKDEMGLTTWEAAMNALRIGEAKAVIVSSPSRKMAVREMRDLAEMPKCRGCGERLPRSPRIKISHLFSADTTEPVRECPSCGETVIARVRMVRASTLDNRSHLDGAYQERVEEALASGSRQALGEYGGEALDDDNAAPIGQIRTRRIASAESEDPWRSLIEHAGLSRVIVAVDPATTGGSSSATTGVIVAGLHSPAYGEPPRSVVGLQDWSVPPEDVEGSPSRVWAPRVAILAALWRAQEVVIETNQGGLEVLDPARRALASLRAADLAPYTTDQVTVAACLRAAQACEVIGITRRASKAARWDWASIPASVGDLYLGCAPWIEPEHWATTIAHVTGFVPDPQARKSQDPIDRGDTLISAAQRLLGAREIDAHRVADATRSPMFSGSIF